MAFKYRKIQGHKVVYSDFPQKYEKKPVQSFRGRKCCCTEHRVAQAVRLHLILLCSWVWCFIENCLIVVDLQAVFSTVFLKPFHHPVYAQSSANVFNFKHLMAYEICLQSYAIFLLHKYYSRMCIFPPYCQILLKSTVHIRHWGLVQWSDCHIHKGPNLARHYVPA